jgi:hypothetical protein
MELRYAPVARIQTDRQTEGMSGCNRRPAGMRALSKPPTLRQVASSHETEMALPYAT